MHAENGYLSICHAVVNNNYINHFSYILLGAELTLLIGFFPQKIRKHYFTETSLLFQMDRIFSFLIDSLKQHTAYQIN